MDRTAEVPEYTLGLDLGSASIGWALIALDSFHNPQGLLGAGVRIFEPGVEGSALEIERGKDQSKAVARRERGFIVVSYGDAPQDSGICFSCFSRRVCFRLLRIRPPVCRTSGIRFLMTWTVR